MKQVKNPSTSLPQLVSGLGQFHTNDINPQKPEKKLKEYLSIDLAGIRELVDNPQSIGKESAQWFIPSTLASRTFKEQEDNGLYYLLWADLDVNPKPLEEVKIFIEEELMVDFMNRYNYEIYASKSAREDWQKGRILIPLDQPLFYADWVVCQEILNDKLNESGFTPDRASERAAQLCYLPNRGEFYISFSERDGVMFNPLSFWREEIIEKQADTEQKRIKLEKDKKASAERRAALKMTFDAQGMPNTIGDFNSAYTVQELLIANGYAQSGDSFRHPNSESGSYSASVKDNRVHTLSTSDPLYTAGEGAHDAFGVFQVLHHNGDRSAALKDAGENWLTINGESYNKVKQREYMQSKASANVEDFSHRDGINIHSLADYIDFDVENHKPQEFIFDNKIQAGIVLLAGGHGCGKTTQLVPLLCRATHLCVDDELRPTLKRKIIYVTEDPNQVERILHSMWLSDEFRDDVSKDEIKSMFKVVEAKRMPAKEIVKVADEYLKETIINYNDETKLTYEAKPLVVIDTISASIHLESDNDNSEVGEVIARFKQEFKGVPVLLIAHLAKGLLRADVENMTARGAGAWEADAHQVMYLTKDKDGARWLDISFPKHRFHADADGITFRGVTNEIISTDLLGNSRKEKLIHGKPIVINEGGKKLLKESAEQERKESERQKLSERIYYTAKQMLRDQAQMDDDAENPGICYITRNELRDQVGGSKQEVLRVIKALISLEILINAPISKEHRRDKNHRTGIQMPEKEFLQWDISKVGTA